MRKRERDSLSTFPHFLFISSVCIHFLYQNCHILWQNVKYGTLVASATKILGRIRCEKAPQVVPACLVNLHCCICVDSLWWLP